MFFATLRLVACGFVFGSAAPAGAQETARPYEPLTPELSDTYDSYTADPSESYVAEPADDERDPRPPARTEQQSEEYEQAFSGEPAAAASRCHEFQQNVFVRGESVPAEGKVCQQSDGSWRLVSEPTRAAGTRTARSFGICREYEQNVVVNDRSRTARGKACQREDGSWRIVTAPSLASRATAARVRPDYGDDGEPTFEFDREDARSWRAFNERRAVDRRRYRDDRY